MKTVENIDSHGNTRKARKNYRHPGPAAQSAAQIRDLDNEAARINVVAPFFEVPDLRAAQRRSVRNDGAVGITAQQP